MNVSVLAGATTKFGELWEVSPRVLVSEVVKSCLFQSGLGVKDIGAVYVGNMLAGTLGGQDHLGAFFTQELGIYAEAMRVEGACASGGLAVHTGFMSIASGMYKNVLVIGVEKMTDFKPEDVAAALMGAGSEEERQAGATFPGLYALMVRAHMEKYGTTEEELAMVAVKNHFHASLNSHAQFTFPITIEQVMKSAKISSPLKLLDCSPISDGAAAVILSSEKGKVNITASSVATDSLGISERKELTSLSSTILASQKAYIFANITPDDIDVAEVHDCFTIAEIMALEDLGFYKKGEAAKATLDGKTRIGSKRVINTSGGLKACGHPVGATGVKQIVEIYQQLTGVAGKKQVENAKIGLTHNVGGTGATAVIHILKSLK